MNKRIKTVWALSIAAMLIILGVQAYWLSNQYEYACKQQMEQLKSDCAKAIKAEQEWRMSMRKEGSKDSLRTVFSIEMDMDNKNNADHIDYSKVRTSVLYERPEIMKRVFLKGIDLETGVDISSRYLAWRVMPMSKRHIDSLLSAAGHDTTRSFRFYKYDKCIAKPRFAVAGSYGGELEVRYSANPLEHVAVAFSVAVKPDRLLRSMAWQLAVSTLLALVLLFCLSFQVKTIMIQKRIDGIRREFMKNMVYEMKQPPASGSDGGDAVRIGKTDFYYSSNELRHGGDKVIITSRQAEILRILARRMNGTVSREELLTEVWGDDSHANSMALNVQISYLRRALKGDDSLRIEAVIRKGYMLKVES